jgi:hypothetical protein
VGKIDNTSSDITVIDLESMDISPYTPDYWFDRNQNTDDSILEGISTDYRGNVYVINTLENQIYVLDQTSMAYKDRYMLNPQGRGFYIEESFGPTVEEYNMINRSLQAQGDWSGFRWLNKYGPELPYFTASGYLSVSGQSMPLNFYKENPYNIVKINESFNMTKYMKDLAFMPVLRDSDYLFDTFFNSFFGGDPDGLDTKAYEKIANYVINHSDIETCNIDQLYDLSNMVDLNTDDFQLNYPESIKRIVNLASINESLLWGGLTMDELDSKKLYLNTDPIDTTSFMVTAGVPMVLKTKSLNTYRILPIGPNEGRDIYSIQDLATSLSLDAYFWRSNYEFYILGDNIKTKDYANNIIDWDSDTNISPVLSSVYDDWIGDQGILETILSYELFSGLDLYHTT